MFGFKNKSDTSKPDVSNPDVGNKGFFDRLRDGLSRSAARLTDGLTNLIPGGKIDDAVLDELESRLITADVGVETTTSILGSLRKQVARKELGDLPALIAALRKSMVETLKPSEKPLNCRRGEKPFVVLVVGVNGAGKTTSIGKLARYLLERKQTVILAAGDTFRAAAVEQLQVWGARNQVSVIAQAAGADPAAVVFDALQAAKARGVDVLIADTAGRLHTQSNLMEELKKVKRVLGRIDASAPHEVLLVLDGSQGQNALQQAKLFNEALGVTGIVITKLDGTAKGGVVLSLAGTLGLPIRFIGVGESIDDFSEFNAEQFVDALLQPSRTVTQ